MTKSERYREILGVLARHGIGVLDDQFIKHEARDQARAEHLRRTHWTIRVTEGRPNELIRYETVALAALTTHWDIYFGPGAEPGQTEVREVMHEPLGRLGRAALALIGKYPAEEVVANLHRLKQILETGQVTDASYAVAGKFVAPHSGYDVKR